MLFARYVRAVGRQPIFSSYSRNKQLSAVDGEAHNGRSCGGELSARPGVCTRFFPDLSPSSPPSSSDHWLGVFREGGGALRGAGPRRESLACCCARMVGTMKSAAPPAMAATNATTSFFSFAPIPTSCSAVDQAQLLIFVFFVLSTYFSSPQRHRHSRVRLELCTKRCLLPRIASPHNRTRAHAVCKTIIIHNTTTVAQPPHTHHTLSRNYTFLSLLFCST